MATATIAPILVTVGDTPYKPGVLVGGNGALSDDSDTTYAEQWLSYRSGTGTGPQVTADWNPRTSLDPVLLRMRFEVANEFGGTGTRFILAVFDIDTGDEVGIFSTAGGITSDVPATDTIYDLTSWTWEQTHPTLTLADAITQGIRLRTRRELGVGDADGDYMIRVYELNFVVTTPDNPDAIRLYPRDDGRGIGNSPRIHPPTKANRIVGGYQ